MPEQRNPQLTSDGLSERFLLLPVDFDAYVQVSAIASAELFVVDDVRQFEYYRGKGQFEGWPRPQAAVGEALGDRCGPRVSRA